MSKNREQSCKLQVREAFGLFPTDTLPLKSCSLCQLLRSDGRRFFCGLTEKIKGGYINRPALTQREVRLARGVVVDGNPIPAGTILHLVGGRASQRVWCRRYAGRGTGPAFLVDKQHLDFGQDVVEIEYAGVVKSRLSGMLRIGNLWLPMENVEVFSDAWEDAVSVPLGKAITKLRLPVWLAREKGLEVPRR